MFRQKALDALNTPEKLDQPSQLIRPSFWILLLSLSGFTVFLLLWSIFGRIPVRISGKGILIQTNATQPLQSEQSGRLISYQVNVGDCVNKNQVVARVDSIDYDLKERKLLDELRSLRQQNESENILSERQLGIAVNDLNRLTPYRKSGSITEDTFITKEREIAGLKASLLKEQNARVYNIINKELEYKSIINEELQKTAIRAPRYGCITDKSAQIGQFIQQGTTILEFTSGNVRDAIDSFAYFSPGDGKRIKIGQSVQITPATTKSQRHGGVNGKIISVKELPVSKESLMIRLGSTSIVDSVFSGSGNQLIPLIEVKTSLIKDPQTFSGYDWGGGPGPELKLTPGTPTELRVMVEGRAPISYLIPLLRDLTGIY